MSAQAGSSHVEHYVRAVAAVGGLAAAMAYGLAVQPGVGWSSGTLALFAVLALGYFALQRRGFIFHWRGQRLVTTFDEPVVFLGLLLLPWPAVVLVVFAGTTLVQIVSRRLYVKALFNMGALGLAASVGGAVFLLLTIGLGWFPMLAAVPAVASYTLVSDVLTAGVFARVEGVRLTTVVRQRFVVSTAPNLALGPTIGVVGYILWGYHPAALLLLLPLAALALGFGKLNAAGEREIRAREYLGSITNELVGTADEETVAKRVLAACDELFLAGYAELEVRGRTWSRSFEGGTARTSDPIEAPIVGREGPIGTLRVWPGVRVRRTFLKVDEALLKVVAGSIASALESAWALAGLVDVTKLNTAILDNTPAGILCLDAQGRVVQANRHLVGLVGSDEDPWGSVAMDWAPIRADARLTEAVRALVERGQPFFDLEITSGVLGGPVLSATGVRFERGSIVLVSDITVHKRAEEALRSQTLTRPFVRRLVLSMVSAMNAPRSAIAEVGRKLAAEVESTDVDEFTASFRSMGLGNLRFERREGESYVFSADDLLERQNRSTQPTCHLALGFVEGAVARVHGASLGSELRCQSQGHARCEFVVQARAIELPKAPRARSVAR